MATRLRGSVDPRLVRFHSPTDLDIELFAANLRDADKAELAAATGRGPIETLTEARSTSDEMWAYYYDGSPMAIWGYTRDEHEGQLDEARVWAVGTDLITRRPRQFWALALEEIDTLLMFHDVLTCWADTRNTTHTRWLEACGFVPGHEQEVTKYSAEPVIFRLYTLTKEDLRV